MLDIDALRYTDPVKLCRQDVEDFVREYLGYGWTPDEAVRWIEERLSMAYNAGMREGYRLALQREV